MNPRTLSIIGLGLAALLAVAGMHSVSAGPIASRAYLHSYNLPASGIAIDGYSPVAYFEANEPMLGSPEYASVYKGVTYHLHNAAAKAAFDANPEEYIPAYGGWCAFGMAIEDKFPIDPTNFKIVDGRLMLFLRNPNVDALELWNGNDEAAQVKRANAYWKQVQG